MFVRSTEFINVIKIKQFIKLTSLLTLKTNVSMYIVYMHACKESWTMRLYGIIQTNEHQTLYMTNSF